MWFALEQFAEVMPRMCLVLDDQDAGRDGRRGCVGLGTVPHDSSILTLHSRVANCGNGRPAVAIHAVVRGRRVFDRARCPRAITRFTVWNGNLDSGSALRLIGIEKRMGISIVDLQTVNGVGKPDTELRRRKTGRAFGAIVADHEREGSWFTGCAKANLAGSGHARSAVAYRILEQ